MAAIAALGRLGDEPDIELLERIVVGDAGRYTCNAAERAIERIRSRSSTD